MPITYEFTSHGVVSRIFAVKVEEAEAYATHLECPLILSLPPHMRTDKWEERIKAAVAEMVGELNSLDAYLQTCEG